MKESHCIICFNNISEISHKIDGEGSQPKNNDPKFYQREGQTLKDCSLLERQLPVIFLLQKFLEIPKGMCSQFLQTYGDPCSWMQWCNACSILVDKAKRCFDEIACLQKQFEKLKVELKNNICQSEVKRLVEIPMLKSQLERTSSGGLTYIVRSYVMKSVVNYETQSEEPQVKIETEDPDYDEASEFWNPCIEVDDKIRLNNSFSSRERNRASQNKESNGTTRIKKLHKKIKKRPSSPERNSSSSDRESEDDGKNFQPNDETKWNEESNAERSFRCKNCPKQFKTRDNLRMHVKTHIAFEDRPFKCDICDKKFLLPSYLKEHMVSHTKDRPHVCQSCGKSFKQSCSLLRHKKEQECGMIRECAICQEKFTQTTQLAKHHITAHKEEPGPKAPDARCKCPICGKMVSRAQDLNRHIATHSEERPHSCPKCGKKFKHSSEVTGHIRVMHSGFKFSCSTCDKKFKTNSQARLHEQRVHSQEPRERNSLCTICGKTFLDKNGLNSHLISHSDDKPISCTMCDFKCNRNQKLKRHLLTHTGEKPFSCSVCEKRFPTSQQVKLHLRTHTGEKPYLCNVCGKSFADRTNLIKHSKAHESNV